MFDIILEQYKRIVSELLRQMICGFLNSEINLLQVSGEHELVWFMLLPPSTAWLIWQHTENYITFVFWTWYHSNAIVLDLHHSYAMLYGTCYSLKCHINRVVIFRHLVYHDILVCTMLLTTTVLSIRKVCFHDCVYDIAEVTRGK